MPTMSADNVPDYGASVPDGRGERAPGRSRSVKTMAVGALAVAACCALLTARAKPFEAMLPAQTTKAETQSNIHVTYKMYRAIPTHLKPMLDAGECVPKLGIRYARADAAAAQRGMSSADRRRPPPRVRRRGAPAALSRGSHPTQ